MAGLPTSLVNKVTSTSATLSDFSYTYLCDGNVAGKTETINGVTNTTAYTYDTTGRLTKETVTGNDSFNISYTYDSAGNRKTMAVTGAANYTTPTTMTKTTALRTSVSIHRLLA